MTKWSITRDELKDLVKELGQDPNNVFKIVITPHQVDVHIYDRDEDGKRYFDEGSNDVAKHIERLLVVEEVDTALQT